MWCISKESLAKCKEICTVSFMILILFFLHISLYAVDCLILFVKSIIQYPLSSLLLLLMVLTDMSLFVTNLHIIYIGGIQIHFIGGLVVYIIINIYMTMYIVKEKLYESTHRYVANVLNIKYLSQATMDQPGNYILMIVSSSLYRNAIVIFYCWYIIYISNIRYMFCQIEKNVSFCQQKLIYTLYMINIISIFVILCIRILYISKSIWSMKV